MVRVDDGTSLHWYELEVVRVWKFWYELTWLSWQSYELTSYRLCRDLPMQSVPILRWGVLHTTLCDKVCQWLATGQWFSPGTPVSFTNKTDCHNIAEILLKVALNSITNSRMNLFRLTICIVCMYSINLFNELACVLLYIFQLI